MDLPHHDLAMRTTRLRARAYDLILMLALPIFVWTLAGSYFKDEGMLKLTGIMLPVSIVALLVWYCYLLTVRGQTPGKILNRIKIVDERTGKNAGFMSNVAVREFLTGVLSLIPGFAILDSLWIFHKDKKCLHDNMARTVVVNV